MNWVAELASEVEGRVDTDEAALAGASSDFGRVAVSKPVAVVRAASSRDVEAAVKFAAHRALRVAPRGAGHSQNGQSLARDIQVDIRGLDRVVRIDPQRPTITCQAGISWRELLASTLPLGLSPPVLTNNLDVTVGGTLSTGGLGVSSWRYGTQVDHCLGLEVVTGAGERLRCSPESNPELYNVVRAGLGWFGVITEATLALRRHQPCYRTFFLLYDDLGSLLADLEVLIGEERFDYLEAWCAPLAQGLRLEGHERRPFAQWFFPLHCTIETGGEAGSEGEQKLKGLHYYKHTHTEQGETQAFFSRLDALFDLWKAGGFWDCAHPWMESILPWKTAPAFIRQILDRFPPQLLAGGHILLWPARGGASAAPLFCRPPGDLLMGFGLLPSIPKPIVARALPMLTQASSGAVAAGGKRYLSGWLDYTQADWKTHFGVVWPRVEAAKRRYDPQGVFNGPQGL